MAHYALTEKSKNLITTKTVDGQLYALMMIADDTEYWLLVKPPEPVKLPACSRCGFESSVIEKHHIYGRKQSKETILLCPNCHAEKHAGLW
jgi:hypothetical protein